MQSRENTCERTEFVFLAVQVFGVAECAPLQASKNMHEKVRTNERNKKFSA